MVLLVVVLLGMDLGMLSLILVPMYLVDILNLLTQAQYLGTLGLILDLDMELSPIPVLLALGMLINLFQVVVVVVDLGTSPHKLPELDCQSAVLFHPYLISSISSNSITNLTPPLHPGLQAPPPTSIPTTPTITIVLLLRGRGVGQQGGVVTSTPPPTPLILPTALWSHNLCTPPTPQGFPGCVARWEGWAPIGTRTCGRISSPPLQ